MSSDINGAGDTQHPLISLGNNRLNLRRAKSRAKFHQDRQSGMIQGRRS